MCGGTYGQPEALNFLENTVLERRPDGLLFAGGVLPRPRNHAPTATSEYGYTKEEGLFVERFFSMLGRLKVFSVIIPGVCDAPLDQFLHLGMKAELEFPQVHLAHATPVVAGDLAIFGLGGSISTYTDTDIGYCSRTQADYYTNGLSAGL